MTEERLTEAEFIARVPASKPELERILATESVRARVAILRLDDDGQIRFTVDMPQLTGVIMGCITALAFGADYRSADELFAEVERRRVDAILGDVDVDLEQDR